jgi:hypothetical protein
MTSKEKPFKSIISCENSTIAFYQRQIHTQQRVLAQLKTALPQLLAEKISHCVVSNTKLVLYVESSEWLLPLKICQPLILESVSDLARVEEMQIRVRRETIKTGKTEQDIKVPSAQTIDEIRKNAQLDKDDELSQSLLRLSKTLERLS